MSFFHGKVYSVDPSRMYMMDSSSEELPLAAFGVDVKGRWSGQGCGGKVFAETNFVLFVTSQKVREVVVARAV